MSASGPKAAMVEIETAPFACEAQEAGLNARKRLAALPIRKIEFLCDFESDLAVGDDRFDFGAQRFPSLGAQGLVHPAGEGSSPMHAFTADVADDFLPVFAKADPFECKRRVGRRHADNVPSPRITPETEQKIGGGEMEKMKGMGLQGLSQMQEPSKLFRCGGQTVDTDQLVNGLGCRQMMADRANAAEPLDQNGDFPVGAALDETLESPKFNNVEPGLLYPVILIQEQRHFAVTLHPGDRINDHAAKPLGAKANAIVDDDDAERRRT